MLTLSRVGDVVPMHMVAQVKLRDPVLSACAYECAPPPPQLRKTLNCVLK